VTVEGVETEAQLAAVMDEGCIHEAQGFLFSRPVPADQVPALLTRGGIKIAQAS
jgi:EAL domain-containing protein (putative c-di-GMP-specific phosphodiesterase class I)